MSRLNWGATGTRYYETGVDRGVLYVNGYGVAWTGLTSVVESPSGGEATPRYIDGIKYSNTASSEEFAATITAFTYPDEFAQCDGTHEVRSGLFLHQQIRKPFGLSYRTKIGNDLSEDHGYKIHLVYNALVSPSERENATVADETDPNDFSWTITTRPPVISGYKPTAHFTIDSRDTDPEVLSLVEDILYGTEIESPRMPTFEELLEVFDTISEITVTDNGDGTFTVTAPFDTIRMLDDTIFEITSPTAVFIDEDTYTISSSS